MKLSAELQATTQIALTAAGCVAPTQAQVDARVSAMTIAMRAKAATGLSWCGFDFILTDTMMADACDSYFTQQALDVTRSGLRMIVCWRPKT